MGLINRLRAFLGMASAAAAAVAAIPKKISEHYAPAPRHATAKVRNDVARRAWAANNEGKAFYQSATVRRLPAGWFWKRDALPGADLCNWPEDRYAWRVYRAPV